MKLKQHRQDVKELKQAGFIGASERYQRLILAYEQVLDRRLINSRNWTKLTLSKRVQAVLRDAEVKK